MLWLYFRSPFPKAQGFSAYRMPGVLVHGPVILLFVWLGAWLCLGEPWTYALFIVYLVAGIYLGRDLAILAHYNMLITLAVLGGTIWLVASPPRGRAPFHGERRGHAGRLRWASLCTRPGGAGGRLKASPSCTCSSSARNLKAVEHTLDEGADANEQDTLIGWKFSPLHVAVALPEPADTQMRLAMIELLAGRGADLNGVCDRSGTPLGLAIEKGRTPLGLRLLALGADPDRFGNAGSRRSALPPGKATGRCSKRWSPPERISRHARTT